MSLLKTNEIQNYNGSSLTLTASTVSTSAQLNTGGNISVTGSLNVSDDSTTRTNLGLGTIATQDSSNVSITGGTIGSGVVFQNAVQPGTVLPYAGASAPTGFLMCDGSAVSRSTYASLFSAISTNWGSGDGSTTFNIPDLRGEFLRGLDTTEGNDPDYATRTLGSSQAATSFRDGIDGGGGFLTQNSDGSASGGTVLGVNSYVNNAARNYQSVRPRNKAINYIIKI